MAVEVMVRVSPRMYVEDMTVLRSWLEQRHPGEWSERRDGSGGPGLSTADIVLTAVLAGAGEAAAKAAMDAIGEMLHRLAERYPATEPPPASVQTVITPDPDDGAEPAADPARDTD
jgi:hypothetical protein